MVGDDFHEVASLIGAEAVGRTRPGDGPRDPIDDPRECIQLRTPPWHAPAISRRHREDPLRRVPLLGRAGPIVLKDDSILRTVLRPNPNTREASRVFIPSTRHARRTRAYISTRYIPPPSSQSNPNRRLYAVPFWSAAAGSTGRLSGGLLRRRCHRPGGRPRTRPLRPRRRCTGIAPARKSDRAAPNGSRSRLVDVRSHDLSQSVASGGLLAMSLSLLKFVGQASLVDDAMLPS